MQSGMVESRRNFGNSEEACLTSCERRSIWHLAWMRICCFKCVWQTVCYLQIFHTKNCSKQRNIEVSHLHFNVFSPNQNYLIISFVIYYFPFELIVKYNLISLSARKNALEVGISIHCLFPKLKSHLKVSQLIPLISYEWTVTATGWLSFLFFKMN